jgi:hypothetical protein
MGGTCRSPAKDRIVPPLIDHSLLVTLLGEPVKQVSAANLQDLLDAQPVDSSMWIDVDPVRNCTAVNSSLPATCIEVIAAILSFSAVETPSGDVTFTVSASASSIVTGNSQLCSL